MTKYTNFHEAFLLELSDILYKGDNVQSRGGGTTLEKTANLIQISHSQERVICVPGRKNNIFATVAETLWVLAGRNDMDYLSTYLPRARDFSDDGETWRAGYGTRIRKFGQDRLPQPIDQLQQIVQVLRKDVNSRQAVMSLWEQVSDYNPSKDIPCTNWIHFLVRNRKLNMSVAIRSNDIMWGASGINWFEWSVMQKLVANSLGIDTGDLNYFADSFHLYDRHIMRAERIDDGLKVFLQNPVYAKPYYACPAKFNLRIEEFDELVPLIFEIEKSTRGATLKTIDKVTAINDEFIRECLYMLFVYNASKEQNYDVMICAMNSMKFNREDRKYESDLRIAALEYIYRHGYDIINSSILLSTNEAKFLEYIQEHSRQ